MSSIVNKFKKKFSKKVIEEMSLSEYLERARTDKSMYATVYERLLKAIGPPKFIDTSKDERLGRIHGNRLIKTYDAFSDFYGIENSIEQIVAFLIHASQGLEEANQILYLLGPPGSAKSSLAARLKSLVEQEPIYILKGSPIQESPLGLFTEGDSQDLGIPARYLKLRPSALALQQLAEVDGDITKIRVQKVYPSEAHQRGVGIVVASDPNTQDVSTIVGKLNIRNVENYDTDDPRAYSFSGGLCHGNQGIMEFIEMFKADIKMLNPLLTATQEHFYQATEAIPMIPFHGMIMAHSNEEEWDQFRDNKANEAMLDRVTLIKVPYCLRYQEEVEIYKKILRNSDLADAPCAPGTLEMLAKFVVLTRIDTPEISSVFTKMHVYNGEHMKDKDNDTKSLLDYKAEAHAKEGFVGISTREAYKLLARVFNFDPEEIAANPVHLLKILKESLPDLLPQDIDEADDYIKSYLEEDYFTLLSKDIVAASLDSANQWGQSVFDKYFLYADQWVQDRDYRDPDTGQLMNRKLLEEELEAIEKPADIANPKDFRQQVVQYCIRYQSKHGGNNPPWTSYNKFKDVIEKTIFSKSEDILPMISFSKKGTDEEQEKHEAFLARMKEKGYTEKQVRLVVEYQQRYQKSKE